MLPVLIFSLISGFFVKLTDIFSDSNRLFLALLSSLLSSFLLLPLPTLSPSLSPLFLGTLLGVVLMGKVDTLPHGVLATSLFLSFLLFNPLPPFLPTIFFFLFSALDEADLFPFRPFLPVYTALYALFTRDPLPLLSIAMFDFGYGVAERWGRRFL